MFDQLHRAGASCHVSDHTVIKLHTQHWALQSYTRESMREGCIINILMFLTARFKQFAQYLKRQGIEVLSEPLCVFANACVCACVCDRDKVGVEWEYYYLHVLLVFVPCHALLLFYFCVLFWGDHLCNFKRKRTGFAHVYVYVLAAFVFHTSNSFCAVDDRDLDRRQRRWRCTWKLVSEWYFLAGHLCQWSVVMTIM